MLQSFQNFFPSWTSKKLLMFSYLEWIELVLLILSCLILTQLARFILQSLTEKIFRLDKKWHEEKAKSFSFPFGIVIFSLCWLGGMEILELSAKAENIFQRIGNIFLSFGVVWSMLKVVDILSIRFEKRAELTPEKFDDILIPLVKKTLKIFIICFGGLYVAQAFTLNVTNILAGLGVGGLAFALAAKDTIANLFGSLTVVLDKPFEIGDWVIIGGNIEGAVEQVGFRSTRIRTITDTLISVPNSNLTNIHIENYGRRQYRCLKVVLGLEYDTAPEKIDAFCEGLRELIKKDSSARQDRYYVHFYAMSESSLDILVQLYWKVSGRPEELEKRHQFFRSALQLAETVGVSFAFPTRTLHLASQPEAPSDMNG